MNATNLLARVVEKWHPFRVALLDEAKIQLVFAPCRLSRGRHRIVCVLSGRGFLRLNETDSH